MCFMISPLISEGNFLLLVNYRTHFVALAPQDAGINEYPGIRGALAFLEEENACLSCPL